MAVECIVEHERRLEVDFLSCRLGFGRQRYLSRCNLYGIVLESLQAFLSGTDYVVGLVSEHFHIRRHN